MGEGVWFRCVRREGRREEILDVEGKEIVDFLEGG